MNQSELEELAAKAKSNDEPYRYEQADEPTPRVTKFFGRIYQGDQFVSRIGTKMAEEIVGCLNREPRANLALEVFDCVIREFEVFGENHIGADLAYLLGAILDDPKLESFVDWSQAVIGREVAILAPLREKFPADSPLWKYIVLDEEPTK